MPKQVKPPQSKKAPPRPGSAKKASGKPGSASTGRVTPKTTARYTPPTPKADKVSPKWVPIVMFTSLALGMLVILANYVSLLPGGEPSNYYLLLGLALITIGFVTATKYQ